MSDQLIMCPSVPASYKGMVVKVKVIVTTMDIRPYFLFYTKGEIMKSCYLVMVHSNCKIGSLVPRTLPGGGGLEKFETKFREKT